MPCHVQHCICSCHCQIMQSWVGCCRNWWPSGKTHDVDCKGCYNAQGRSFASAFLASVKGFVSNKSVELCVWDPVERAQKYGAIMKGHMRNFNVSNHWSILRTIGFLIIYKQKSCVLPASSTWNNIHLANLNWKCWCPKVRLYYL